MATRTPVFLLEPFDLGEGLGQAAPGDGGVFEDRGRRDAGHGRKGGPPGGGEAGGLGGIRGLADLVRPDLFEDPPDPFGLLGDDRGVAVDLDQEEGRHLAGESDGGIVLDAVDRRLVHDLEGRRDDPGGDDLRDRLAGGADVPEIGEEGALVLRRGDQADRHLGDDPEGPFAADEQIAERIAGHVLDAFSPGGKLRAVIQEAREGHDVVPGDAVLEPPEAAGVFRDVAAERGDVLGAGVGRVEEPPAGRGVEQIDRDDARFGGRGQVLLVDLEDAVHPGEPQNHAARRSGALPPERPVAAPRGVIGEPFLAADGQRGLEPFDVLREDGHVGEAPESPGLRHIRTRGGLPVRGRRFRLRPSAGDDR